MTSWLRNYHDFQKAKDAVAHCGLGEGNTPLVANTRLVEDASLYFKMEQMNPTGSFKDRFAAVEAALIKDAGHKIFIATSSGNTGAALSAYAARYDLNCLLFVNEITPINKLTQMLIYGAKVFRVKDFGITNELSAPIFDRLQKLATQSGTRLSISAYKYSPEGMDGVKSIAYELKEQFGGVPDNIFVPVGGGGLLSGIWRGFLDLKRAGLLERTPRIHAVQPALNDTVVTALNEGRETAKEVQTTTTISGLAVQVDIDATRALTAVRDSGGFGVAVSDEDIFRTQHLLCEKEGIYVEPAGATSVAGYLQALSEGSVSRNENSVCILTGHGLKDSREIAETSDFVVQDIGIDGITDELLVAE